MLIKAGVDISRLERNTRRGLHFVDTIYAKAHLELVVTSTFEGNHGAGSLHYANQAFDVRLPPKTIITTMVAELKRVLGNKFDIVYYSGKSHIHIEYDPKS